jgi:hypothetical protein
MEVFLLGQDMGSTRIVLMGKDFELRLVSLIVRARESCDEVILLDLGSEDGTIEMAKKVDCRVINYDGPLDAPSLAKQLLELEECENTLLVHVTNKLRLRDLPLLVNRSRERWDVHMSFTTDQEDGTNPQEVVYSSGNVSHMAASTDGLESLAAASIMSTPIELPSNLKVRVLYSTPPPKVQQRESLASASRFAQLFLWMLESKHPLLLFGIPGVVFFIVGYKLSGNVLDTFNEWNQTTIGVGLAVISVTIIGLFAMMVGLILYIMGKQVKQIQAQYDDWPNQ